MDHSKTAPARSEKIYVLAEFPYPSGSGLHIGHAFTFTGADVYARFQRLLGRDVLFPIGWDAFGLPTENYAIRTGRAPQDVTRENTDTYRRQMEAMGFSFDWDRLVNTTDPSYYRWTQWIFIKLYEHGLAYKKEMAINWCPKDKIGLANEEVINGRCERCGTEVVRRRISQWVVRITDYADRLIDGLEHTEFIEKVKAAQINWIGRSQGARVRFAVEDRPEPLEVFTTRPDTLWGVTFMVIAPEHPLAENAPNIETQAYIEAASKKSDLERTEAVREKTGVFSGLYARHPATGERLPIWVSDFVLPTYGSGAVMAVPAHDQRDFEFAARFGLPVRPVVEPPDGWDFSASAYTGSEGTAVNSGPIDGLPTAKAIPAAVQWLQAHSLGEPATSYHLRDWIFSRQRYWGEPIPMVYCEDHGWQPVPESDLPVVLPPVENYQPTDTGASPLANVPEFINTTCPRCGGPARRETDTMPNWAGSDWYFLRYTDPHNDREFASMEKMRRWLPVDVYIGGDEHNTLHLLYSRFIYLFLHDIGMVPPEIPEPFKIRLSHGVILGEDNTRMSKSRGNVVVPDVLAAKYSADAVRAYLLFMGPYDATMAWNERALLGVKRFLDRFERFVSENASRSGPSTPGVRVETNRAIQAVKADIAAFKYNTAIARLMEGLNTVGAQGQSISRDDLQAWITMLSPFAPFTAESCWQKANLNGSLKNARWPAYDPNLETDTQVEIPVQINGKLRATLMVDPEESEASVRERAAALEPVARHLQGATIRKVIFVPGRTINFVVG